MDYCTVSECDRVAFRNGVCSAHVKQHQRTGKYSPIAEKLSPEDRAIDAGNAMIEAGDDDDEYETAKRAFLTAAKALGAKERVEALRQAMARARARGARIGRPPKVTTQRVVDLMELLKRPHLVAAVLGVTRMTIYRHLARCNEKHRFVTPRPTGPRAAGGST